ncbi:MAG: glycosyltransferase family 1 protein [Pseudomonadota bacterium]
MPVPATAWLGRVATDVRMGRALAPLAERYLSRPFSRRAELRVQIYATRNRISFSQIYPFLRYAPELRHSLAAEVRCTDIEALLSGAPPVAADVFLIQPWFTVNRAALSRVLAQIREVSPDARVILLDPCAHNDLRLARDVEPFVDLYVKKALFRDRKRYLTPTRGDTNLTDFYGLLYGQEEAEIDWRVPRAILPKLRAGPGFFTAPGMMERFLGATPNLGANRPIDMHARLTTKGSGWYAAMRNASLESLARAPGQVFTGTGISRARFFAELQSSKLVFSPFGYGELCWRDIEGMLAGAVIVKQDMAHLETCPDLFRPWETYVPVAWDFSDLPEQVARVLRDDRWRVRIAEAAFECIRDYLRDRLLDDLRDMIVGTSPLPQTTPAMAGESVAAC